MTTQFLYRRREFLGLVGAGVSGWSLAARAQQSLPVVGLLSARAESEADERVAAFHQGLNDTGYFDGKNVAIEYRWAENQNTRLPALVGDLVRRQVKVIVAIDGTPAALAAKAATSEIPILFNIAVDPVGLGLVANLNKPGGNATGVSTFAGELGSKHVQLMHEVLPGAGTVGLLVNPTSVNLTQSTTQEVQAMVRSLGLQLEILTASTDLELDAVFGNWSQRRANFLVIGADAFFTNRVEQLASLTLRHLIPAVYWNPRFAAAGGLVSYGTSPGAYGVAWRLLGVYAGRILRGERPSDLPVHRLPKIGLSINLRTARALGLTVPPTLLARADEVIE